MMLPWFRRRAPALPAAPAAEAGRQALVDAAYHLDSLIVVIGWATAGLDIDALFGGKPREVHCERIVRDDVAAHLRLPSGAGLGFVLLVPAAEAPPATTTVCFWGTDGSVRASTSVQPQPRECLRADEMAALGAAAAPLLARLRPHSPAWRALLGRVAPTTAPCRGARGHLEAAAASTTSAGAVVVGWVVYHAATTVWLEDDLGGLHTLDNAFRHFRQDVLDAVGDEFPQECREAGFCIRLPDLAPGQRLRLKALSATGLHVLGELSCAVLPADPVAAARWLFAVHVPLAELHRRVAQLDLLVLGPLIEHRATGWRALPVRRHHLGTAPPAPRASVIVPLYGRIDFVEHQLIEFCQDPWFVQYAELIYVIDDPRLVEPFSAQAEALHRLYRVPFQWLWGGINRGFSGANNLGAAHARAPGLVFLNSDAFPQRAGWVQALLQVLDEREDIGAVGPRLVFGDGAIQHGGMAFLWREDLGIWINHHPRMGLDPALDPHTELTELPAITGACLALRRRDFDRLGGWDTGYLVGDFEDSDLCLQLRAAGLKVAYLPSVQLTHLERQSLRQLGDDGFRARVVIFNAVRHQGRWARLIESTATTP